MGGRIYSSVLCDERHEEIKGRRWEDREWLTEQFAEMKASIASLSKEVRREEGAIKRLLPWIVAALLGAGGGTAASRIVAQVDPPPVVAAPSANHAK